MYSGALYGPTVDECLQAFYSLSTPYQRRSFYTLRMSYTIYFRSKIDKVIAFFCWQDARH